MLFFGATGPCPACGKPVGRFAPHLHRERVRRAYPVGDTAITPSMEHVRTLPQWAPTAYGEYYATSVPVYAAVKKRADNLVRAPLKVYRVRDKGDSDEVPKGHPLRALLSRVNPFWTFADLLRATSTHLDLWGAAFWVLDKPARGAPNEVWLVRPDRVSVIPSRGKYIAGYEYHGPDGRRQALLPDEVVWFRYFNPLDEFAGMSPVAPLRLSLDMGQEAVRYNRNAFRNGLQIGNLAITTQQQMADEDVEDFYRRLRVRYASSEAAARPLIMTPGMEAKNLGLSQKDMEYVASLRWTLEEAARAFQVPLILLEDLSHATYSNVDAAERMFWRNTVVPQLRLFESHVNEFLTPQFGEGLECRFDLSQIEALQEDAEKTASRQRADIGAGVLTINEVRQDRGLEPVPWGDVFWAPLGLLPVGDAMPAAPSVGAGAQGEDGTKAFVRPVTAGVIERALAGHLRRTRAGESLFQRLQRGLFEEQERDVQRLIAENAARPPIAKGIFEELFNLPLWRKRFVDAGSPVFGVVFAEGGREALSSYGIPLAFDAQERLAKAWLDRRVAFWADRVNGETARLLTRELEAGRLAGESIRQLQQRVSDVFGVSDAIRTERIARTEVLSTSNHAALEAYRQSGVVSGKRWLAVHDDRTRDAHLEADGQEVPLDAPFIVGGEAIMAPGEGTPGQSINCRCLPSNVAVGGTPILSASRRWYEGDIIEIATSLGNKLSGTPNHPILTNAGWVALGSLRKGDYVLSSLGCQQMSGVNPDVDDVPTQIGEVFDALTLIASPRLSQRVKGAPMDFHGDGRHDDIDIVAANNALTVREIAARLEHLDKFNFPLAHRQMSLTRDYAALKRVKESYAVGLSSAPAGYTRAFKDASYTAPADRQRFGKMLLGFSGQIALDNISVIKTASEPSRTPHFPKRNRIARLFVTEKATLFQHPSEPFLGGMIAGAEHLDALPRNVISDCVVDVRIRRGFAAHVFNLQTTTGWYVANGIITHNCALVPILEVGRAYTMGGNGKAREHAVARTRGDGAEADVR